MIELFSRSNSRSDRQKQTSKISLFKVILIGGFLAGVLCAVFIAGVLTFPSLKAGFNSVALTTGITWRNKTAVVKTLAESLKNAPGYYLNAVLHNSEVPVLRIDIKFKHYEKLRQKREVALARGFLDSGNDDYVPARIRYQDRNVRVKLRLKGDLPDHYMTDRWSFRIKVRGDDHLFGMKRFSVQHPMVRRHHREPLYLDHMRREGVLAPRYFFIRAVVNGEDVGLMAVEEHFSKELLESQQRREGVILRFNGDNWWYFKSRYGGESGPYYDFLVSDIEAYQEGRINRIPRLKKHRETAIGLLRGFLEGKLTTSDVFDVELMARYLVVNKLWNAEHTTVLDNLRLYLNPVSMRIEPIGFDGVPLVDLRVPSVDPPAGLFYKRIFDDPKFRTAYFATAKRIGEEAGDPSFIRWVEDREKEYLLALHQENPLIPHFLGDVIRRHSKVLSRFDASMLKVEESDFTMTIPGVRFPQVMKAYLIDDDTGKLLELRNIMPVDVMVTGISVDEGGETVRPLYKEGEGPAFPIPFPARANEQTGRILTIDVGANFQSETDRIIVTVKVAGHDGVYRETAIPYVMPESTTALPRLPTIRETLLRHPFLEWRKKEKTLFVLNGDWSVQGDIILPDGIGLVVGPGTRLRFEPDSIALVRGPVTFEGTKQAPVVFEAKTPADGWGGLVVMDAPARSYVTHSHFRNLNGVQKNNWILTGGVTFRKAPVEISESSFSDVQAEDALNVIRSEFLLQNSSFRNTRSDAIDSDHSNGKISGGRYTNVGGDGIDISGTKLVAENVILERINDKAFSIGEGSDAHIVRPSVSGAGTGVASKDGSRTRVEGGDFTSVLHVALMSYVKKPSYGPAELIADDVQFSDVGEKGVVQTGSSLTLNKQDIDERDIDVDALYSDGYMKK